MHTRPALNFLWLRRGYQAVFLALFFYLVLVTTAHSIGGYPVDWFLGFDPLVAAATALATFTLRPVLAWSLVLAVITLIFGRFFCGWMCPFGVLHQMLGWLGRPRRIPERVIVNRPRSAYRLKYLVLMALLVAAFLGSNQVGLLDPIAFMWRAVSTVLVPAASNSVGGAYQGMRHFHYATVIALGFFAALALNLWVPRLYCRLLCPLGALLGLLSRFSLFRLERDETQCTDCNACGADCQGAAEPQGQLRATECMLCLNCLSGCPRGGIRYRFMASPRVTVDRLDLGRRRALTAVVSGALAVPFLRVSDGVGPRPSPQRIRPPGAVAEADFLDRCVRCGVCMKACPTGGLLQARTGRHPRRSHRHVQVALCRSVPLRGLRRVRNALSGFRPGGDQSDLGRGNPRPDEPRDPGLGTVIAGGRLCDRLAHCAAWGRVLWDERQCCIC